MNRYHSTLQRLLEKAHITINGAKPFDITVTNDLFYERVMSHGSLGLGESYMDGWWECSQLDQFFYQILKSQIETQLTWREYMLGLKARVSNRQNYNRGRKVARTHYDLGNLFFEKMLDKRMIYSCAYWKDATTLDQAQTDKLELVCRKLGLTKNDHILDIGCGWGGFLKFASERYQCHSVGICNSVNQAEYARAKCAGLPIEIIEADYRDLTSTVRGKFNKVVSIGMFEHVGPKNYNTFFRIVNELLLDGGLFLLQTIGDNVSRLHCDAWLDKYIFPNGVAPSIEQLGAAIEGKFVMEDWHNFGEDYDRTLLSWCDNFERNYSLAGVNTVLSSTQFFRMWEYYLKSFASAFRARHLQLWQIVLSKGYPRQACRFSR
jgi:cyclopropane-fatty-acyl-phospholipid synthase